MSSTTESPTTTSPNGISGDVDADGGHAGDRERCAVLGLDSVAGRAQLGDQDLGGGVVGRGIGRHLEDRGLETRRRDARAHARDAVDLLELAPDRREVVEDVGGLRDVERDEQRPGGSGPKALGDEVVGLALRRPGGLAAAVGQVEVEREGGDRQHAEQGDDRDARHDGAAHDTAHPATPHGRGARGVEVRPLPGARTGLRCELRARRADEGGQQAPTPMT
jgi:hypothetical protein